MNYTYISFKIEARKRELKTMTKKEMEGYKSFVKKLSMGDLVSDYNTWVSEYAINDYEASKRKDDTKSVYEGRAKNYRQLMFIVEAEILSR